MTCRRKAVSRAPGHRGTQDPMCGPKHPLCACQTVGLGMEVPQDPVVQIAGTCIPPTKTSSQAEQHQPPRRESTRMSGMSRPLCSSLTRGNTHQALHGLAVLCASTRDMCLSRALARPHGAGTVHILFVGEKIGIQKGHSLRP